MFIHLRKVTSSRLPTRPGLTHVRRGRTMCVCVWFHSRRTITCSRKSRPKRSRRALTSATRSARSGARPSPPRDCRTSSATPSRLGTRDAAVAMLRWLALCVRATQYLSEDLKGNGLSAHAVTSLKTPVPLLAAPSNAFTGSPQSQQIWCQRLGRWLVPMM